MDFIVNKYQKKEFYINFIRFLFDFNLSRKIYQSSLEVELYVNE